jgi:hypothetical protein
LLVFDSCPAYSAVNKRVTGWHRIVGTTASSL